MMNEPAQNENEVLSVGKKLVRWVIRFQLIGALVGGIFAVVGTIAAQTLVGFWEFRDQHQKLVLEKYQEMIEMDRIFSLKIERYNKVVNGEGNIKRKIGEYSPVAHEYIQSVSSASDLLVETRDELTPLVSAIASLNQYYDIDHPPAVGTEEWGVFYGKFRQDYNNFLNSKAAYLKAAADEVGDYYRHVVNPSGT